MTRNLALGSGLLSAMLVPAAILAPAPQLKAEAPEDDNYLGESPERYAQVKVLEGDVRVRKGDADEALSRGIPISEGDVVESRGRGVLQLGDGTRIAFGASTRFTIAALFTEKNGERQALLRVDYGRLRVTLGNQSQARIRVDTPSGTGTITDRGSVGYEVERDRTVRVKVYSGRVSFSNEADRVALRGGERLTAYSGQDKLDRVREFNTYDADSFDEWADRHLIARRSASWEKVPSEIRYYSDDLDEHGEWVQVEEVGYCWRPRTVVAEWRPYWHGRWGCYGGGMTWVSDEPWGYVTYHHGRWGWHARWGWYWIPGVYYSPAWVAWNTHDTYFGWAPLGYWNTPCTWGYGAWGGGHCWNVINYHHLHYHNIHHHTHHNQAVLGGFNRGISTVGVAGNRPLTPPWRRGPLILNRSEFQNPNGDRIRQVMTRDIARDRLATYERGARENTGRAVLRRDPRETRNDVTPVATPGRPVGTPQGRPETRIPFEDRSRPRPIADRPVFRDKNDSPGRGEGVKTPVHSPDRDRPVIRPVDTIRDRPKGEDRPPIVRPVDTLRDRPKVEDRPPIVRPSDTPKDRPRVEDRPPIYIRPTDSLKDRPRVEKPSESDRPVIRPSDTPRERPREDRPRDSFREERKPEPVRERPHENRRPDPPKEVRPVERPSSPPPSPAPSPSPSRGHEPSRGLGRR